MTSIVAPICAALLLFGGFSGGAPPTDDASPINLIYHGGAIEHVPAVYLVFWGPEWKAGFTESYKHQTYSNTGAINYVQQFFGYVGGSPWAGIQTQYCDNIDPGFSCDGQPTARYVTNPAKQLKGTWIDTTSPPSNIDTTSLVLNGVDDPLATEALAAAKHFGYDVDATYFIFTGPTIKATLYGSYYCAYHDETSHTTGHGVRYAFIPYVPGACFSGYNKPDSFGHGYFDAYSIVAGHEYAEAVTDPDNQNNWQDGWNDFQTDETGDKCTGSVANITLGSTYFAVQSLWSNRANAGQGACVFHL